MRWIGGRGWFAARLAVGIAAAAAAMPAQAQLGPAYSGQSGVREASTDEFYWALSELGSCLAASKPKQSLSFLAAASGSSAEGAAAKQLIGYNASCLRNLNRMGVERKLLRGAVAEALYKKAAASPLAASAQPGSAPTRMSAANLKALGYDGLVDGFTACLAALRPDLVHQLLVNTRLGSKDEEGAVAQISPSFSDCLPNNIKLNLHPAELRLALAEAAYRRLPQSQGNR